MSPNKYLILTDAEIQCLEAQGCQCGDWSRVLVSVTTDLTLIRNVRFYGDVRIGELTKNSKKEQGIYNAVIRDCDIADNVYISNVGGELKGVTIGNRVRIENVGRIVFDVEAPCGIGVAVGVLDETGSRQVYIYPGLTAQMAALMAYKPRWTEDVLLPLLHDYFFENQLPTSLGDDSEIVDTVCVENVSIGREVKIKGALNLKNGAVLNNAPKGACVSHIGHGVNAENFIVEDGIVSNGVIMRNCFVGQGAVLDKGFTAHDSLFFANCACENGEACAVLAGPYTVTMHKSTLLIGGQYSFMNAGSGTNSSNHMYKLGPVHWGVMQRGVKTSSDAYMMWGGRIGAFSLLMGSHKTHPDTSFFPFSYLFSGEKNETIVVPGVMLKSCGMKRDETKWPKRDKRIKHRLPKHDNICFDVLNPVTVSTMIEALDIFDVIKQGEPGLDGYYMYKGLKIKTSSIAKGQEVYRQAILKYLYDKTLNKDMSEVEPQDFKWVDLLGQILPYDVLLEMQDKETLEEITGLIDDAYERYEYNEMQWIKSLLNSGWASMMDRAEEASRKIDEMIDEDRRRSREMLSLHNNQLSQ